VGLNVNFEILNPKFETNLKEGNLNGKF